MVKKILLLILVIMSTSVLGSLTDGLVLYLPFNNTINDYSVYHTPTSFNGINTCYQETANVSTDCGGLATGKYAWTTHVIGGWQLRYSTMDGSFSTYGFMAADSSGTLYAMYINYTKPENSLNASWFVRDDYGSRTLEIPLDCWNYDATKIILRVNTTAGSTITSRRTYWNCYNGTWKILSNPGGSNRYIYEERIYWNISKPEYTTDKLGVSNKAIDLNGINQYINLSNSKIPYGNAERSICYFIKTDSATQSQIMWYHGGYYNGILNNLWYWISTPYLYTSITTSWTHICEVENTTGIKLYKEGIYQMEYSPKGTNTNARFYVGRYDPSSLYYDGNMDEFRIYNRSLSTYEIKNLYGGYDQYLTVSRTSLLTNNQSCGNFDLTLSITGFTPDECSAVTNDSNVVCSDISATTLRCIVGGSLNKTVSVRPYCNGGGYGNIYDMNEYVVLIDTINPIITHNFTQSGRGFYNTKLTGQFNFTDNYLYRWNVTIDNKNINGSENVAYTKFVYNLSYNTSSLKPGSHVLKVIAADGHTSKEIKEYKVKTGMLTSNYLQYETGKNKIKIESKDKGLMDTFTTEKLSDRYTFSYKPSSKPKENVYSFIVETDQELEIVEKPDSEYKTWIVSGDNWIDFIGTGIDANNIKIKKISSNKAEVTLKYTGKSDEIQFNSVGDLNVVQYNFTFYTINASVILTTPVFENEYNTHKLVVNITGTPYLYNDINATFLYNNTVQTLSKSSSTYTINFTKSLYSPNVSAESNISAYFNISFLTNPIFKKAYNQTVKQVEIANCADEPTWNETLTLICQDEETLKNLTNCSININIDLKSNGVVTNSIGFELRNAYNYSLCVEINPNITIDAKIEYDAVNYSARKYYLNDFQIDDVEDTVYLYHLDDDISSDIIINVYDQSTGEQLNGAYVKILRYYPGLDNGTSAAYRTVEIEKTDSKGQSGIKAVLGDVWYKYIIEYPVGTILLNSDIEKILTTDKYLPVRTSSGNLLNYNEMLNINSEVDCDDNTGVCRFTWSNPSNSVVRGELKILEDTGYSKILIYSTYIDSAASSIAYTITGNATTHKYIAEGWIYLI